MSQKHEESSEERELRTALIEAYWQELSDRYDPENLQRFEDLAQIPPEKAGELRRFFLYYIYPPADRRHERDDAFNNLSNVLRSPRKLWPLMGQAFSSVFKLGRMITRALKAAYYTLDCYFESQGLEKMMLAEARKRDAAPEDFHDRRFLHGIVRAVPESKVMRFQKEVVQLFNSLADTDLLKSTLEIMEGSKRVMEQQTDLYSPEELGGLTYGQELLQAGYDLFLQLDEPEVKLVLSGIDKIEKDWYRRVKDDAI